MGEPELVGANVPCALAPDADGTIPSVRPYTRTVSLSRVGTRALPALARPSCCEIGENGGNTLEMVRLFKGHRRLEYVTLYRSLFGGKPFPKMKLFSLRIALRQAALCRRPSRSPAARSRPPPSAWVLSGSVEFWSVETGVWARVYDRACARVEEPSAIPFRSDGPHPFPNRGLARKLDTRS